MINIGLFFVFGKNERAMKIICQFASYTYCLLISPLILWYCAVSPDVMVVGTVIIAVTRWGVKNKVALNMNWEKVEEKGVKSTNIFSFRSRKPVLRKNNVPSDAKREPSAQMP